MPDPADPLALAYSGLCWYDPRSPNTLPPEDHDDRREPAAPGCACDPCYHGKDKLARALLAALEDGRRARAPVRRFHEAWSLSPCDEADAMHALADDIAAFLASQPGAHAEEGT